jgi:hypothetical protein
LCSNLSTKNPAPPRADDITVVSGAEGYAHTYRPAVIEKAFDTAALMRQGDEWRGFLPGYCC